VKYTNRRGLEVGESQLVWPNGKEGCWKQAVIPPKAEIAPK